ncbi:hypothetical protein [Salinibacter altiplanensis]|uniref:hypothetical protein n=1 Tax=Salinibacter altiplanensis TaxID=1803181 RepID=UPI001F307906|nr:hypothetical protein [Salinibacter altiplanensis]
MAVSPWGLFCLDLYGFAKAHFVTERGDLHQILHRGPVATADSDFQGRPAKLVNLFPKKSRQFREGVKRSIFLSNLECPVRLDPHEENTLPDDRLVRGLCALWGLYVTGIDARDTDHPKQQDEHDIDEPKDVSGLAHSSISLFFNHAPENTH